MATGSYEGSLSMEGTSDRHKASSFTIRCGVRSGDFFLFISDAKRLKRHVARAHPRRRLFGGENEGGATEVSEARWVRASWEENAHAGECEPRGEVHAEVVSGHPIRRSGSRAS
jgi:hypothetical protein